MLENTINSINEIEELINKIEIINDDIKITISELKLSCWMMKFACKIAFSRINFKEDENFELKSLNSISNISKNILKEITEELKEIIEEYKKIWLLRNRIGGLKESVGILENLYNEYNKYLI